MVHIELLQWDLYVMRARAVEGYRLTVGGYSADDPRNAIIASSPKVAH